MSSLRQRRARELKDLIYRISMGLFRTQGYEKVSVALVCQRCGISKGSFFSYFPTKADVLFFWLDNLAETISHSLEGQASIPRFYSSLSMVAKALARLSPEDRRLHGWATIELIQRRMVSPMEQPEDRLVQILDRLHRESADQPRAWCPLTLAFHQLARIWQGVALDWNGIEPGSVETQLLNGMDIWYRGVFEEVPDEKG